MKASTWLLTFARSRPGHYDVGPAGMEESPATSVAARLLLYCGQKTHDAWRELRGADEALRKHLDAVDDSHIVRVPPLAVEGETPLEPSTDDPVPLGQQPLDASVDRLDDAITKLVNSLRLQAGVRPRSRWRPWR